MTRFPLGPGSEHPLYEEDLDPDPVSESQARASRDGREFDLEAFEYLKRAGARLLQEHFRVDGYPLDALVEGGNGARFYIDAHGTPDRTSRPQAGMRRQDTMLKFGCKAYHWRAQDLVPRLILVTSHMPTAQTASARTLQDLGRANALWDAVQVTGDLQGFHRLQKYLTSDPPCDQPLPAPWRDGQLQLRGVGRPEAY